MLGLSSMLRALCRPAALGLLAALALSGCGGSGPERAGPTTSSNPSTPAASTATSAQATSTSTTTARTLPGTGRPVVTIGDKNYTEQFVLGQLYLQALKAQGFSVNISDNIGPPSVVRQALKSGSLAMYPEYLDVFAQTIAHVGHAFPSRAAAYLAGQRWAHRHGLVLLSPTPFSDTDGVAVTVAYAQRHRLRTLMDLARVGSSLVIGGAAQFKSARPGLPTLARVYGVFPHGFDPLAVGDQYGELDGATVQAAFVNTTDGQLASGDYRVLADPRRIFGFGNVVPVLSGAAAGKEGPAFAATIERVDRTLTMSAMRQLNNAVDVAGQQPSDVANQYLETHGLLDRLRSSDYRAVTARAG